MTTNTNRARWAKRALAAHDADVGNTHEPLDDRISDLMTNLLHLAHIEGADAWKLGERAIINFLCERDGEEWVRCYTCSKILPFADTYSLDDCDGPLCADCDTEVTGRVHEE